MQSELRKKLLKAFTEHEGEYLSGQYLADLIGCSRTAVWKHMDELRKEGFELEAVRRKGYRIVKTPRTISPDEIRLGLKTEFIGQTIHYEETVDSTQIIAKRMGMEGAQEGTVVIAEEQLKGKGRLNRHWHSPPSSGVWMSIILRPNIPIQKAPQLTLLTAVAIVKGIQKVTNLSAQIKWPNDVFMHGKKVTGILTELLAESDRINAVIIGIGINVNQKKEDFPEDLQEIATSLAIEAGKKFDRATLIRSIFQELEKLYKIYLSHGFDPIKQLWEKYSMTIGKMITARTLTENIFGKALGITNDGVLLIEDEQGKIHHIFSADIQYYDNFDRLYDNNLL